MRRHTSGFDALDRKFERLEAGPADDVMTEALLSGLKIIGDEERRLIPVASGRGRNSITETTEASNLPSDGRTGYVGPERTSSYNPSYLKVVEFGDEHRPAQSFGRQAVALKGDAACAETARVLRDDISGKAK